MNQKNVREIVARYKGVSRQIGDTLAALTPESFTESKAAAAKMHIGRLVDMLDAYAAAWSGRVVIGAYDESRKTTSARLAVMGKRPMKRYNPKRHVKARAGIATAAIADLHGANDSIRKSVNVYIGVVRRAARDVVGLQAFTWTSTDIAWLERAAEEAVAQGVTRKALSQQIMDYLKRQMGDTALISITGKDGVIRSYQLDQYSEMVASYRMREAQTEAVKEAAREYDAEFVQISDANTDCEECAAIEGEIFSLTGKTPGVPVLTDELTPPLHPHCRHVASAISDYEVHREGLI